MDQFGPIRKVFEKTGPTFGVDHFSRSDWMEFWLNGSCPKCLYIYRLRKGLQYLYSILVNNKIVHNREVFMRLTAHELGTT